LGEFLLWAGFLKMTLLFSAVNFIN
jgi:hypothetical protein